MSFLLHETLLRTAVESPDKTLLRHRARGVMDASGMAGRVAGIAAQFAGLGLAANDRVGVYLEKLPETALAFYAANYAGGVFVPINPVLKAPQVGHIINDCDVSVLVTSAARLEQLTDVLATCPSVRHVLLVDTDDTRPLGNGGEVQPLTTATDDAEPRIRRVDDDMSAILYTSGSTGRPKGVIISHRNIVSGAVSVSRYLEMTAADNLLAVLPFSFDYGLNQLTTCVLHGAECVLFDYLLPRDVIKAVAEFSISGLAAVPPLWTQLANLPWPEEAQNSLRYITNSGGAMPEAVLAALRAALPTTTPYLMYGLTEAFRSTFLPPAELEKRPTSIGKAIPNAEILVVREDGSMAAPGEHGELVHRGSLVALGYWNQPDLTAERFKPAPRRIAEIPTTERCVWSGDTVYADDDGFLYFVGRTDAMIKSSGYRISPEEIEEVIYSQAADVETVAAIGVPHPQLGQAIVAVVQTKTDAAADAAAIIAACRATLPNYMVPARVLERQSMPYNANGKIDRRALAEEYRDVLNADTEGQS